MTKKHKISFCTVCMNRLHYLKQTLPKNIEDNLGYGYVEFVVLNYNSEDELDEWIKMKMHKYIDSGILNYFSTSDSKVFQMSHSKNVVARCATGEIICNIDADNFTGEAFAEYINEEFNKDENIFVTTDNSNSLSDCFGRICVKKQHFQKCRGYDEKMQQYGFEDIDFKNRLEFLNLKKKLIDNKKYLSAIQHGDEERLSGKKAFSTLNKIYIYPINHASFILILLFKNLEYFTGKVIKNRHKHSESVDNLFSENRLFQYEYILQKNKWFRGRWSNGIGGEILKKISVDFSNKTTVYQNLKKSNVDTIIKDFPFSEIEQPAEKLNLMMFFHQITNRIKMLKNKEKSLVYVNRCFGRAKLIKNFKEKIELK